MHTGKEPGSRAVVPDLLWLEGPCGPVAGQRLVIERGSNAVLAREGPAKSCESPHHMPGVVLPGFVDCHVHLGLQAGGEARKVRSALDSLERMGLKAVRDAGDRHGIALREAAYLEEPLPLFLPAGRALRLSGGYGDFLGPAVRSLEEGTALIDQLAEAGAKAIKLILTGLLDFHRGGRVSGPYMDAEGLRKWTRAAHAWGLRVMAHANTDGAVREAIAGGVDSIEHGYCMTAETLRLLADEGTAWIPTLSPLWHLTQQETHGKVLKHIEKALEGQLRALKVAVDMGVLVGVGTDLGPSGLPPARAYFQEILLYRQAGLSWEDILRAACFNGYKILGLDQLLDPPVDARLLINLPPDLEAFFAAGNPPGTLAL